MGKEHLLRIKASPPTPVPAPDVSELVVVVVVEDFLEVSLVVSSEVVLVLVVVAVLGVVDVTGAATAAATTRDGRVPVHDG